MHPILGKRRHTLVNVRLILRLHEVIRTQSPSIFLLCHTNGFQNPKWQLVFQTLYLDSKQQAGGQEVSPAPSVSHPLRSPPTQYYSSHLTSKHPHHRAVEHSKGGQVLHY